MPAGAHAEREQVMRAARDQVVIGRAEFHFERRRAVLDTIDDLLRLLDTHAHLERLLHHRHAAYFRAARSARQFAIGERAGAAFTEEIIAFRAERAAAIKALHITNPFTHRRATFQNERLIALLGEKVARD